MKHQKESKAGTCPDTPLWDSSLPVEERLDALLEAMTGEEKLKCLTTGCPDIPRLGIRSFHLGGEAAHGIEARHDQDFNRGEPQPTTSFPQPVGMSASWDRELMEQIGTAVGEEARVLYQKDGSGGLCRWAPTIDMERDPRWGRTEEAYGEDPFLTGEMAGAYICGMRGDDPFYLRCGATLKHFYANNQEKDRVRTSSSVDPRNKREYYLEPFRRAVKAGAEAVMTSYNEINGVPAIVNPEVRELLKDAWGLPGHVVCDGGDMQQTVTEHHYFSSHAETVAFGLKAGVDCFTDDGEVVEQAAKEALERGLITWEDVDRSIRNSFRTRIRLGLYDGRGENPYRQIPEERLNSPEHGALSRRAVRESAVLLKNETLGIGNRGEDSPLLPLKKGQKIAVIGPWADVWYKDWYCGIPPYSVTVTEGIRRSEMTGEVRSFDGYDRIRLRTAGGYLCTRADGSLTAGAKDDAEVFRLEDWGSGQYLLFGERTGRYLTVREDGTAAVRSREAFGWFIREAVHFRKQPDGSVKMESWDGGTLGMDESGCLGCISQPEAAAVFYPETAEDGSRTAEELARWADVVLYAAGCNPVINSKEEIDREDLALPPAQERQLFRLKGKNPKIVLLLITNYPYAIVREQREIPAIVQCASGSQELGNGLADLLFGKESFAGRLPMTWYRSTEDLPPMEDYDIIRGRRTYQYFDGETLYPFGYGKSYTEFTYRDLQVRLEENMLRAELKVRNSGSAVSDEVVQIYLRQENSRTVRPKKQLKAFRRIREMQPGEERTVCFEIPTEELKYYDVVTEQMVLEQGTCTLMAGASSEDIRLEADIEISGTVLPARTAETVTKADHYDDCREVLLYQGHDPECAVYVKKEKDATVQQDELLQKDSEAAEMVYRDYVFASAPRIFHALAQGNGSGEIEVAVLSGGKDGETWTILCREWENCGKPVWKNYLLDAAAVEKIPVGERTKLRIRIRGSVGIARFSFAEKLMEEREDVESDRERENL